jgi:predicted metal-dependent hydrolase
MPVQRERDDQGRARNARPRDELGRPLPRGSVGVPRIPDELVLEPLPSLAEAQRLLDAGMPFHAHEVLEGTWKAAPPAERDLWQGLAQLAVGYTHLLRGNPSGATTLLQRARRRISLYADDPPYGVDVEGLSSWADHVLAGLADGHHQLETERPRLRTP